MTKITTGNENEMQRIGRIRGDGSSGLKRFLLLCIIQVKTKKNSRGEDGGRDQVERT